MKASKIIHRSEARIRVDFPYNQEMVSLLRQIPDARWSKTLGAWHIPYTKEAYKQLKELFPDIETPFAKKKAETIEVQQQEDISSQPKTECPAIDSDNKTSEPPLFSDNTKSFSVSHASIEVEYNKSIIYLKIPKNDTDIQFLRSFQHARWDNANYRWTIPNWGRNLSLLLDYLKDRDVTVTEHASVRVVDNNATAFQPNEILAVNLNSKLLKVFLLFHRDIVLLLKCIPLSRWNDEENCWVMPYSEYGLTELKKIADSFQMDFRVINRSTGKGVARKAKHPGYLKCPDSYVLKLKELRYSENTLKSYTDMFEEFINHYPKQNIDEIDDEKIIDFIRYLVMDRKVSTSYQNQSINAIHPVGFLK